MAEYIPPSLDWVREQVEKYEGSDGTEGTTLLDTGLPCIIVTHTGNKSGGIRKIPLMRVKVDDGYVLVGSMGGQPKNPVWVYNLRAQSGRGNTRCNRRDEDARSGGHGRSRASASVGRERRGLPALQRLSGQDVSQDSGISSRTGVGTD